MNSLETLTALLTSHQRAAGHTTAALKVAENTGAVFIVADENQTRSEPVASFMKRGRIRVMSLDRSFARGGMMEGVNRPILVDHYAMTRLLSGVHREVLELNTQLENTRIAVNTRKYRAQAFREGLSKKLKAARSPASKRLLKSIIKETEQLVA